jgi:D-amino peptidase
MRVYISADIEGVATTSLHEECYPMTQPATSAAHARQMSLEVKAACEGAIAAGADYILVRDGHATGTNIDMSLLPQCAELIRGWTGHPYAMVEGVDSSFDAAMYIGYHSAAGRDGNPLCHTRRGSVLWIKLNGVKLSEFQLFSWACALEGVPSVLLTGDKMLCEDSKSIHPKLVTVAVKDGFGGMTRSVHPEKACSMIKEAAEIALKQDLSNALCQMPKHFVLDICYKEQAKATYSSFYPGFHKIDDNTIHMETDNYLDVLRCTGFIL